MSQDKTSNFCIIAHINHGKSTLADRLLELTGTIEKRNIVKQTLDTMDLEREKGITIKLKAIRMNHKGYQLNLIDTPGHVDFTYEVSRSLAACEGAILLVDKSQGIQAQTVSNFYKASNANLKIIPVINKVDLGVGNVEELKGDMVRTFGFKKEEILEVSAKTGKGVENLLEKIINTIPAPAGNESGPARALVFDSYYDEYLGVIAVVRVVDGKFSSDIVRFMATNTIANPQEIGLFKLKRVKAQLWLT